MVNRTLPLALAALLLTISPARAGDPAPESKDVPADVAKLEQDIVKVVRRISPAFVAPPLFSTLPMASGLSAHSHWNYVQYRPTGH